MLEDVEGESSDGEDAKRVWRRRVWRRDFAKEGTTTCSTCAELRLSLEDFGNGLEILQPKVLAVIEAGRQGCPFCAFVSRSTKRDERTLSLTQWSWVYRKLIGRGNVWHTQVYLAPWPRPERTTLLIPQLDTADASGLCYI